MSCVTILSFFFLAIAQITHQYVIPGRSLFRQPCTHLLCAAIPVARKSLKEAPAAIDEMMTIRERAIRQIPLAVDPLLPVVKQAARSADMRKAASVTALRVSHLTEVTQFVVLIEATNNRQLQALSDTVEVLSAFCTLTFCSLCCEGKV
jgi:hypothetical protein